jgi:hypothetical protein
VPSKLKTRKRRKSEPPPPPTLADLALAIGMNMPLDTRMAALYLGLAPASLEVYRSKGVGPRCAYAATRPRYAKADLDAWLAAGKPKAMAVAS